MSAKDAVDAWAEQFGKVKVRRGGNVRGGAGRRQTGAPIPRAMLARTVRRVPEVMVKITEASKNAPQVKAHMTYITREGTIPLEDEFGDHHLGKAAIADVVKSWTYSGVGLPTSGDKRREALHIMFGMPPGTVRQPVTEAVRAFVADEFEGHQYAFAAHDDTEHPHVHVVVKVAGNDGVRLNPRKADLFRWRVGFAEQLNARGVEANATPRALRGKVRKSETMAVRQINDAHRNGTRDKPADVTIDAHREAEREAATGVPKVNPLASTIQTTRERVVAGYSEVARALATGNADDRALALDVVRFVDSMESVTATQHAELVEDLRQEQTAGRGRSR